MSGLWRNFPMESLATGRVFLPSYSPNLNLIVRLWRHLKNKSLQNKHFKNFAMFRAAIDAYLDHLCATCQEELESLLTLKFHSFGNQKMS
jgi:transposase